MFKPGERSLDTHPSEKCNVTTGVSGTILIISLIKWYDLQKGYNMFLCIKSHTFATYRSLFQTLQNKQMKHTTSKPFMIISQLAEIWFSKDN